MLCKDYYVYILTNKLRTVLYTGVTNNVGARLIEHWQQRGIPKTFTGRYHVYWLIHHESYSLIYDAIAREKEIKGWSRVKKMELITRWNPEWKFLNAELFGEWPPTEFENRF